MELRATKIVATIGPRHDKPGELEKLLVAGADVVRVNAAHCKPGDIARKVQRVRDAEAKVGKPVGVLLDLGGPKIRVGPLDGGPLPWKDGDAVEIVPGTGQGGGKRITVSYDALLTDVQPGHEVRIDDGRIRLRVAGRGKGLLKAVVLVGGSVRQGAGVNFPQSTLSAPALTRKDKRDLREGLASGVDIVSLSFVRTADHLRTLRKLLAHLPGERTPWIVAKIERVEALRDLASIAPLADVMMVARGDLGVELGLAAVPAAQAEILATGRLLGIPVIVATQMLESMVESATPTRAEVSDVAGAVHGGADAVMLSEETAVGQFPVEAVTVMSEIATTAEARERKAAAAPPRPVREGDHTAVVSQIAGRAAALSGAKGVVVYTATGKTARLLSKETPYLPIVAITPTEEVRRKTCILRNVVSVRIPVCTTVEEMIRAGDRVLLSKGLAGATVVEVSGAAAAEGATNTVRIRTLPSAQLTPRPATRRRRG